MATIKNAKQIQSKAKSHQVTPTGPNSYDVVSGNSGSVYHVHVYQGGCTCTCEWAKYRPASDNRSGCSHVVSVMGYIASENGRKASAWSDEEQAKRQHRPQFSIGDNVILTTRAI